MSNLADESITLSDDFLFYTLEGEGEYVGYPSVFMRMAMCNLTCAGFASPDSPHGCDSFISWSIKNKRTFQAIWDEYFVKQGFAEKLNGYKALLKLTGGEPLVQQKQLTKFVDFLEEDKELDLHIDFETNATIMPDPYWSETRSIVTFTTSPKLSTNGDPESKTYKPDVLNYHIKQRSGFKFVVTCSEDLDEIWRKYVDSPEVKVDKDRIWLMPACGSREEHIKAAPAVAEYAKQLGVKFSPRMHLMIWDKALKV